MQKKLIEEIEAMIFKNLAVCFICQKSKAVDGPCCYTCFLSWNRKRNATYFEGPNQTLVCPLWNWDKNDFSMLDLIQMQKSGFRPIAKWLADLMLLKFGKEIDLSNTVFVPVPPTEKSTKDHAYLLANELAKKSGALFKPCLEKISVSKAKNQRKADRMRLIQMRIIEKISKENLIILVDDIYTTGSTANACFSALDEPNDFRIWTLAHRRLDDSAARC